MSDFLTVNALSKNYANGFEALKTINLRVQKSEILALLGPNWGWKTTLISTICGISKFTSGKITLAGHDIVQNYRLTRKMIGMVPQELSLESFETVMNTHFAFLEVFLASPLMTLI